MDGIDRRVAEVFAAQCSLVTRRQAMALGATSSGIGRRLETGRWVGAGRGVYALAGVPWDWRRDLAAVVLSVRGAIASHRAAAALLDVAVDDRVDPPIELTVVARRRPPHLGPHTPRGRPLVVHESGDLAGTKPWLVDGIPTTPPLRLAVDLGSVVGFDTYRRAVGRLRRRHELQWEHLEDTYRQYSVQGRNGCGALRDLLALHLGQESAPAEVVEIRCADLLASAGLPAPVHQFEVVRPDGRRAFFDLAYPDLRIGIETEGRIHDDPLVRQADHTRRNNVQLLGWTVFHFTWEDVVFRPDYVVQTIRMAVAAASAGISP